MSSLICVYLHDAYESIDRSPNKRNPRSMERTLRTTWRGICIVLRFLTKADVG